jgi:hypothetical protein
MAIATKLPPTIERIKELLDYEPETGTFRWKVRRGPSALAGQVAGSVNTAGYIVIRIDLRDYYAHRLVWLIETGEWPPYIDHRSTDKADNRKRNLREATKVQNGQNRGAPRQNTSGHKGVSWARRERRWRADIQVDGRQVNLGYFRTKEGAVEAYRAGALKYHGEFANFGESKNIS